MDISAFSEENFNAVEWINANYKKYVDEQTSGKSNTKSKQQESETSLEFINSYVSKLQLYVQQVNFAVEETSQQLVSNMPHIAKEARILQTDVQKLQDRMRQMRTEFADVQEETGDCMATLERLNTLRLKLETAKESLQESDGWGNLIAELEDCLERNEIKGVFEKLVALQKSLQAQEQLSGHLERQSQVEDFKNRLEALASPSVVACFAEGNIEQAERFVEIFGGIQRLPQLQQYYRAVQRNTLQQQWKQTLDLQSSEPHAQHQHFLTLFYDQLLAHCQRQVKWCSQVFSVDGDNSGQVQPLIVLAELLPALQPSRDAHILQLLKSSNDRLELLQQYAHANHIFVVHLNAFLEQSNIQLPQELCLQVAAAVYEYFFKFIDQYPRLEETQLSTQIDRLVINQATPSDAVRHLDESTRRIFDWLISACDRCAAITSDFALCKLIGILGGIFKRVLENFSKTQRQLSLSISAGGIATENWALLQYTMTLLQCLADFQQRMQKFERFLHERLILLAEKLKNISKETHQISIYQTYDRASQQRLITAIVDYQQKRDDLGIFPQIYDALKSYFIESHDIALNILLQPIESHLLNIQPVADLHGAHTLIGVEMPAFSFAPQEYITQIGQYLLTLPQHLEPLLLSPSSLLKQALEACNIKYTQTIPCADILLSLIVEQCCVLYQTQILQIKTLPGSAAKQLSVDIEYLSSVVEELGLAINLQLSQILTLLKASPEHYLSLSSGCEPRLVTAIRQMRNIISTQ